MLRKCTANRPDFQILVFPHASERGINGPEKLCLNNLNRHFELFKKIAKSGIKTYL